VPLTITNVGQLLLNFSIARETNEDTAQAALSAWQPPAHKVDPALLNKLAASPDGQARFLIYLQPQAHLDFAYAIQDRKARGKYVYETLREAALRTQPDLLNTLHEQAKLGHASDIRAFFIVNAIAVTADRETLDLLTARSDVASIIPEPTFEIPKPIEEEAAPEKTADLGWNLTRIGADRVWNELGVTGSGIVVGAIDTGVAYTHTALVNQYRGSATRSHDYNWYDPTGTYPNAPGDNVGHGTHVMGTILGNDEAGDRVGVAPGAQWIAAKGCVGRMCVGSALLAAAQWMLAPCPIGTALGDPSCDTNKRPQVVNNSWGGPGGSRWFEGAVAAWRAAGIFPVFAAGNNGPAAGSISSPADYDSSFAVGATNRNDDLVWFSSRGPSALTAKTKPNLAAPGRHIRSAIPSGGYGYASGTSMACPHVAGAAALLLSANPSLSVDEIEARLVSTAVDLGKRGPDHEYGYGRLDVYAAVSRASDAVPWLTVDPISGTVPVGGQQVVTVTLNATGLVTGVHVARLVISSNDPTKGTLWVPITLTVAAARPRIADVQVGSVGASSARISWITDRPAHGVVHFGSDPEYLDNVVYDQRGADTVDDTHLGVLTGLAPETTYYFYVSSDGTEDNNDGQLYRFTTGRALNPPQPDGVYGQVLKGDGTTPAGGVLVYVRVINNDAVGSVGESTPLVALTDENGWYSVNLGNVRLPQQHAYFRYSNSGDSVRIWAQGARDCSAQMQVDTGSDDPTPPITLSCLQQMPVEIGRSLSLFTWPQPPTGTVSAETLLQRINAQGGAVDMLYRWDEAEGTWLYHPQGTPIGNFDVAYGEPYIVRSSRRSLLQAEAGVVPVENEPILLAAGLNFVTLPRMVSGLSAEEACVQIDEQGGEVSRIYSWSDETGGWQVHICGLSFADFTLQPSGGYFVDSAVESTWVPEASNLKGTSDELETAAWQLSAAVTPTIQGVVVSDVGDRSFGVTWMTDEAAPGEVRFGPDAALGNIAYEKGAPRKVHQVTVSDLIPDTTYYFNVVSGGTMDDRGGNHYQVTTGKQLGIPSTDPVYGRVLQADGMTPAEGVMVYVTLVDGNGTGSGGAAGTLTARTDADGYWAVNLAEARTADGQAYFEYTEAGGDWLQLQVRGEDWFAAQVVDVSASNGTGGEPVALPELQLSALADGDGDGDEDIVDVQRVAGHWGLGRLDGGYDPRMDLDASGAIDMADLLIAAARWQ